MVIPKEIQPEILETIHDGHPGIVKSRERARQAVWWKGMSQEIKDLVQSCDFCQNKQSKQTKEPLMCTQCPERPWQHVGMDICELDSRKYLVMDYYSRYLEVIPIQSNSAKVVIPKLKTF